MGDPVYVEKWVTFTRTVSGWQAWIWDAPVEHAPSFRCRIRVPEALLREETEVVIGPGVEGS